MAKSKQRKANGATGTAAEAIEAINRVCGNRPEWVKFIDHVARAAKFSKFETRFNPDNPNSLGASVGSGVGGDGCSRLAETLVLAWWNNPISPIGKAMMALHDGARKNRAKLPMPQVQLVSEVEQLRNQGLSLADIAEEKGTSENTLKQRLRRGRRRADGTYKPETRPRKKRRRK